MAYIGKSPTGTGVRSRYYYTATGGETSLSGADDNSNTLVFSDGNYVDVSLNGVSLVAGTDYNTSTANTIGGLAALSASDIIEVVVYDIFTVADTVSAKNGGTFSGNVSMGGDLTVDTTTLHVDSTNNRVGIGTSSPASLLHLDQGSGGEALRFERDSYDTMDIELSESGFRIRNETDGRTDFFISGSGNVGIGTSSPSAKLHVRPVDETNFRVFNEGSNLILASETNSGRDNNRGMDIESSTTRFVISGTERMRIDSSGNLLVGTTSPDPVATNVKGIVLEGPQGSAKFSRENVACLDINRKTSDGEVVRIYKNGSKVGNISVTGSSTSYNTSSDYRLKENVTATWDATTRLKQLNPVRFNFIANPDTTVDGFLAHEVQTVVPEAISGTKDAMRDEEYEVTPALLDEDGNEVTPAVMGTRSVPDYQGIDQSKLVPLLVKTIQELEARIAALENV